MTDAERPIAGVYVFPNGMVAVFDSAGKQVPELQGTWVEKRDAIRARCSAQSEWVAEVRGVSLHDVQPTKKE